MRSSTALLICLGFSVAGPAQAVDLTLQGVVFADYSLVMDSYQATHGLRFRRITLKKTLEVSDALSGRFRLETRDGGLDGELSEIRPFVKHAYLRYRPHRRHLFRLGLTGTPAWTVSERVWGYRPVEKTIMDRKKIASSVDTGIGYDLQLDAEGRLAVRTMAALGRAPGSSTDSNGKVYGLVHFRPRPFHMTAYLDRERRPGDYGHTTLAAFLGLKRGRLHGGVEGFVQSLDHTAADPRLRGLSVFGAERLTNRLETFVRADFFDPDEGSGEDGERFLLVGLRIKAAEALHLMPNVIGVESSTDGDVEMIGRFTLHAEF